MVKGRFPYRRTVQFLSQGRLYFKNSVKCISINYDAVGKRSEGMRLFLGERIPQILYKNPSVSVFAFKNEGHPANVMVYHGDGTKVAIDCIGKDSDRILEELTAVAGKPETQVKREQAQEEPNRANFGDRRIGRFCICEVPGQVPCPRVVPREGVRHEWKQENS